LKTSRAELSKLQRLASLENTGAMRTTPTAAIEVLFTLPPLLLQWMVEAQAGVCIPYCCEQWKLKIKGHGQAYKSQGMKKEPILKTETDKMILRHFCNKPFTVRLPGRRNNTTEKPD
jgi:hypothetical protein